MLSGHLDRRRRALLFSTLASAALHLIFLAIFLAAAARFLIVQGEKEKVSQTETITIRQAQVPTPAPQRPHAARKVRQRESAPATAPRHELAKEAPNAPAQPVLRRPIPSPVQRDQAGFAKEVAQLNAQNDPHAIPTIDPASRESSSKSYSFSPSSSGGSEGNGIITTTQSWHHDGLDCYYGRYEYTYPDGANESGDIAWPFCYDPGADPFKQPPHPMPFPFPLPGYRLPDGERLPPIERSVYNQWAAGNGEDSAP